ncbi:hypothetical protein KMB89_gp11 [Citrobacter phage HCF1]|uniref:Phage protein n=1 Tax=Citrobacter phage HCF1 TaxID=2849700 RepID=A0ABX6D476_9CAUD|nr:hypothetical protein KMB89_gp11 [Citrobacter phage HCF1]
MKLLCTGEYPGFTHGEMYTATVGFDQTFGYKCYVVKDDDGDSRSIDFETEDFIEDKYL